jgi:hypothetical protein
MCFSIAKWKIASSRQEGYCKQWEYTMLPNFSWLDNVVTKLVAPVCEPIENEYCICISKSINLKYAYEQF